jgi:hypothetical protein
MLFSCTACLAAEDPALVEVRALLSPMRGKPFEPSNFPGDPLTQVKHKLKAWIENRLPAEFRDEDEVRTLAHQLNSELRQANLSSCTWNGADHGPGCPLPGEAGYLGEIKIMRREILVVTTNVGIGCAFDQSAYAYRLVDGRWKLFWHSETNDYRDGYYYPLNFLGIHLSHRDYSRKGSGPDRRLLLVLARAPAQCQSNWYDVYYRVWDLRMDILEDPPNLLLDGKELAFLSADVDGVVMPDGVLIQYHTRTTYTGFQVRPVVRQYTLSPNRTLQRVHPLALRPIDFADEWMKTQWSESSRWTTKGVSPGSLQTMHRPETFRDGEYESTKHCEQRPDHWQVTVYWMKYENGKMLEPKHLYLLVRWLPPYRFSMTAVSEKPWPGCTVEDIEADNVRSLFPVHSRDRW